MGPRTLVEYLIDDGQLFLDWLEQRSFPVTVAFWVLTESSTPAFYLSTPETRDAASGVVVDSVLALETVSPFMTYVRVTTHDDPAAREALALLKRQPANAPYHAHRETLGDLAIKEVYIYPRLGGALTPAEVPARALHLMQIAAPPRNVSLRDGTSFRGQPLGLRLGLGRRFELTFHDEAANAERTLPADEIVAID